MKSNHNIEVFFCDDVRLEVGNKLSIMGLYEDVVYFGGDKQEATPSLSRLNIVVRMKFDWGEKKNPDVNIAVQRGEATIIAAVAPGEDRNPDNPSPFDRRVLVLQNYSVPLFPGDRVVVKIQVGDGEPFIGGELLIGRLPGS